MRYEICASTPYYAGIEESTLTGKKHISPLICTSFLTAVYSRYGFVVMAVAGVQIPTSQVYYWYKWEPLFTLQTPEVSLSLPADNKL